MKINVTVLVVPNDRNEGSKEQSSISHKHQQSNNHDLSGINSRDETGGEEDEYDDEDFEQSKLLTNEQESKRKVGPSQEKSSSSSSDLKKNTGKPYIVNTKDFNVANKVVDDSVKFECSALGLPAPTIRWMYNDRPIDVTALPVDSNIQGGHLYIPKVTLKSMGKYTCVAFNELGQDSADFELTVKEKEATMNFIDNYPMESYEVQEGSPVTIKCRVQSSSRPRIEWLKKDFILKEENQVNSDSNLEGQTLKPLSTRKLLRDNRLNLRTEAITELIKIGDDVFERSITIRSTQLSDGGDYVCTCLIGKQFKYKSTTLVVNSVELNNTSYLNVNLNDNSVENFGNLFSPMFLWIFGTIFLLTAAILFILINWTTRSKVEAMAVNAIEMGRTGDKVGGRTGGQIIEGSIDAFGDPINRIDGRALNTYTLINHRPQNYYWTRGRLDAWIDDSDKYTNYRRSKCQHVCKTCKKSSTSQQYHSKRRRSTQSEYLSRTNSSRPHRFGQNNTSEENYKIYQNLRKYEDVRRQKLRLEQVAEVQENLRHDYSAIKYSLDDELEVTAAPNNSPESNNS